MRIVLALLMLTLAACSGSPGCPERVDHEEFSICIGDGWEQVTDAHLREEGVPEETVAAFRLADSRSSGHDNIVVSREALPPKVSAHAYAEANIRTVAATPEYNLIEKRTVDAGGQETLLHIFSARPVPDLPERRFYQLSLTESATGYVFTGTLPFSVDEEIEKELIGMIVSASLNE